MRAAAHAPRAQLEAAHVQNVEGDHVSPANFAQNIFRRYLAVVQNQGAGGRPVDAHLVLFRPDGQPGRIAIHDERGELFVRPPWRR